MASAGPGWRTRRARGTKKERTPAESSDASEDNYYSVDVGNLTLTEAPFGATHARFAPRRSKRPKLVDLEITNAQVNESSEFNSMFAEVMLTTPPADSGGDVPEYSGAAILCFLSPDNFLGCLELTTTPTPQQLKVHGVETMAECNREFCGASECCGEKAYLLSVHSEETRQKRSYIARSVGVGDYVALDGSRPSNGFRFETLSVPGERERDRIIARNFDMLPASARGQAIICVGKVTMHWQCLGTGLGGPVTLDALPHAAPLMWLSAAVGGEQAGSLTRAGGWVAGCGSAREDLEGYHADKSSDASSADEIESSMRSILPMLAQVTMPTPDARRFGFDELLARGGRPVSPSRSDAAGEEWLI